MNYLLEQYLEENNFKTFEKKYDYKKIAKKVLAWAKDGGLVTQSTICGLLYISVATFHRWKKEKEDFAQLLEVARNITANQTDTMHRAAATNRKMNAIILNRRAEHILNLTQKVEQEVKSDLNFRTIAEIDAEIAEIKKRTKESDNI